MRNVAGGKKHLTQPVFNMIAFLLLIVTCILICMVKVSLLFIDLFDKDYHHTTSLFVVDVVNYGCMLAVCFFIIGILRNVGRRHVFVAENARLFKYIGIAVEVNAVAWVFVDNLSDAYTMHMRTFFEYFVGGLFMFFIAYLFDFGMRIEQGKES